MEFSLGVTFFNLPISDDHTSRTREKAVPSGEGGPQWSENAVKRNGRGERGPAKRLGMHHLLKSMIAMLFFVRCFLSPFPRVPSPRCSGRPFPRRHSLHFVSFVAGPFSLRLGHARVLTCHRHVIHYPRTASLPKGDGFFARVRLACLPFSILQNDQSKRGTGTVPLLRYALINQTPAWKNTSRSRDRCCI